MALTKGTYTWNINDSTLINKIMKAKNGEEFVSNVFEIGQLNWRIDVKPNGNDQNEIGSFAVSLKLMKLPSSWKDITICRTMETPQTKSSHTKMERYIDGESIGWPSYSLTLKEITKLKLSEIQIKINIKISQIRLKNDEIYYQIPLNYSKNQRIIWKFDGLRMNKLKLSNIGKRSCSNIYNEMWVIQVRPNGLHQKYTGKFVVNLSLCLLPLNVNKMDVQWTVSIKQFNFKKTFKSKYSLNESGKNMIAGSFEQFRSCDSFEIVIDIVILMEYDNDDKEINNASSREWDKYTQKSSEEGSNNDDKLSLYDDKISSLSMNIEQQFKSLQNEFDIQIQQLLDANKGNQEKDERIKQLSESQKLMNEKFEQNQQEIKSLNYKLTQILEDEKNENEKTQQIEKLFNVNQENQQQIKSLININKNKEQEIKIINDKLKEILNEDKNKNNNDMMIEINKLKQEIERMNKKKGMDIMNKIKIGFGALCIIGCVGYMVHYFYGENNKDSNN